jgi:MurNAc alpha-1-phosphate uridylyltransferase
MQVAILAGGLATRLRPLTTATPKSLVMVHGKPFLTYQLDFLRKGGIEDIVLCVGHLREQIESYYRDGSEFGVRIRYSKEEGPLLGTAGALRNAFPLLDNTFFVIYGDSYVFLDFAEIWRFFHRFEKSALMVVYKNENRYDRSNVSINGNFVQIYNKTEQTPDMVYIDYGVSLLRKTVLESIPENKYLSLETVFSSLIAHKELLSYPTNQRFYEIGSKEGLKEFQNYIREHYPRTNRDLFSI